MGNTALERIEPTYMLYFFVKEWDMTVNKKSNRHPVSKGSWGIQLTLSRCISAKIQIRLLRDSVQKLIINECLEKNQK